MSRHEKSTMGGESETVEHCFTNEESPTATKSGPPVMRAEVDNISVLESLRQYRYVFLIAMGAAFSASLDGYRKP